MVSATFNKTLKRGTKKFDFRAVALNWLVQIMFMTRK